MYFPVLMLQYNKKYESEVMKERNNIPVLLRSLDVLEYIAASPEAVKMSDIQKNLGIPQATCYRMIASFVLHGWLEKRPGNAYDLTDKINDIASKLGFRIDKYAKVQPLLNSISSQIGLSVKLSVLDGTEFVNVCIAAPKDCQTPFSKPGFRVSLKNVASVSTVFLAEMTLQEQKQLLPKKSFLRFMDMYKFYAVHGCSYQPGSPESNAEYPFDTLSFPVKNENRLSGVLSVLSDPDTLASRINELSGKIQKKLILLSEYL